MSGTSELMPELWTGKLTTRCLGRGEICYLPVVDSTNARAKEMARTGAPHGSVVLCEEQKAGRGRLGRSWQCTRGEALMHSLILRPKMALEKAQLFTLAAAVAAAEAVNLLCPSLEPRIKWPNDLILGGKKCAGILCELVTDADGAYSVIVGVGINVNQMRFEGELADKATSLLIEAGGAKQDRAELLRLYLERMEAAADALERDGLDGIRENYLSHSATIGSRVRVIGADSEFVGTAQGIDDNGALLVRRDDGVVERVLCGDVSVRGLMGYA